MSRARGAAVLACALAAGTAGAAEVGARVVDELRLRPRVRVIVALREPTAPATDLTLRNAEVEAIQGNVLEGLRPGDFLLTHRWQSLTPNGNAQFVAVNRAPAAAAEPAVRAVTWTDGVNPQLGSFDGETFTPSADAPAAGPRCRSGWG